MSERWGHSDGRDAATRRMDGFVQFRAHLADGRVITGSIQGRGGRIGSDCAYRGHHAAHASAQRELTAAILNARSGQPSPLSEPAPGHCWLIPDGVEGDGSRDNWELVSLLTTRFAMMLDGDPIDIEQEEPRG